VIITERKKQSKKIAPRSCGFRDKSHVTEKNLDNE